MRAFLYVAGVLAACVWLANFCISAIMDVLAVSKPDTAISVTIPYDSDAEEIGEILKEAGLISFPKLFSGISSFERYDNTYGYGTFVLNTNMGYTTMMKEMKKQTAARQETVMVTIPEGLSILEIAALLEENGVCPAEDFMQKAATTDFGFEFEREIPDDENIFYRLEGYIFPDTYEFYKNDTPLNVLMRLLGAFESKMYEYDVYNMVRRSGMSLHEVITLASIVQGEAPNFEEMERVSSVYNNRINNKSTFPLLQADPTRDYANEIVLENIGDRSSSIAKEYDTYQSQGLPPGPINNPGIDAILAALHPADTIYYYFCTNLQTGEFYYAETLEQHNINVYKAGLRQSAVG